MNVVSLHFQTTYISVPRNSKYSWDFSRRDEWNIYWGKKKVEIM